MTNHGRDGASVARERVAGGVLGLLGTLTLGIGLQFLLARPAMLPEDIRFTAVTPGELSARMTEWLGIVFRTWGGFMAGFGAVLIGVAAYLFTTRRAFLLWGTAIGVVAAFGRFLLSNLMIRSDHVVFIGLLFGLALVAALGLILGSRRP
jgi:hypothetical protein